MQDGIAEHPEAVSLIDLPWPEIRERWRNGEPYWQFYEHHLDRIAKGTTLISNPTAQGAIKVQDDKATTSSLLDSLGVRTQAVRHLNSDLYPVTTEQGNYNVGEEEDHKLATVGENSWTSFTPWQDTLTRLYVSLDPRKATDAYFALVKELNGDGLLSEIDCALVLEQMASMAKGIMPPSVQTDAIVIYVPRSQTPERQAVLNHIIQAYKRAKGNNPNAFHLHDEHRDGLLGANLSLYKLPLDSNLSFVESPYTHSYEVVGTLPIDKAIRFDRRTKYPEGPHRKQIEALKRHVNGTVFTPLDRQRILDVDGVSNLPDGTRLGIFRNLHTPALVEYTTVVKQQVGGEVQLQKAA